MNRAQRRRQSKQDQAILLRGLDLRSPDADAIQALARQLYTRFQRARRDGNIDAPVKFFQSKINASLRGVEDLSLACKKGCSHCCYVCVSATAPEVLFIAKIVRRMGPAAIARVRAAHEHTKAYDFYSRYEHPHACPLLKDDVCTVYETRPGACRFAASRSAEICARAYHNLSNESIPAPTTHLNGSSVYSLAMAAALKRAGPTTRTSSMPRWFGPSTPTTPSAPGCRGRTSSPESRASPPTSSPGRSPGRCMSARSARRCSAPAARAVEAARP